ncbi:MAG: hypothetical protein RBR68_04025 [Tenuifilaceae bacterium]|nr:hypothetical protein [Tenuifilaceae bacterium]
MKTIVKMKIAITFCNEKEKTTVLDLKRNSFRSPAWKRNQSINRQTI